MHARAVNVRNDSHHKATAAIAKPAGRVVVETLNVAGMVRNRKLSRAIADAGMPGFLTKLEYKCLWYGAELVKADRWFPSSRLYAHCGWRNEDLSLGDRRWCGSCGALNERDHNAAVNLKNWPGLSFPVSGRGDCVGPAMPAAVCEASRKSGEDPDTPPKLEYQISSDFLIAVKISMDGKGRYHDNIFVERLWRTVKYEGGVPESLRHRPCGKAGAGRLLLVLLRAQGCSTVNRVPPMGSLMEGGVHRKRGPNH